MKDAFESGQTPLYDELEEKWNAVGTDRRICDKYMRCFLIETGAEWYEDDEGNEVFPEPTYAYLVPQDVKVGDSVTPIKLGEPQYAEGHGSESHVGTCGLVDCGTNRTKRKFKLFGRNQVTNGTL